MGLRGWGLWRVGEGDGYGRASWVALRSHLEQYQFRIHMIIMTTF